MLHYCLSASIPEVEYEEGEEVEIMENNFEPALRSITGRLITGNTCEYIKLGSITANDGCTNGNKFVIKQVKGVRKQFLILNGEAVLGFVTKGDKFADCTSYTEVTANVDCKVVDGLSDVDLSSSSSSNSSSSSGSRITYNLRVELTHRAHESYGYATLLNTTTVALTELFYDGAGPKTNWIVGTKSHIGVDSNTYIIDKLTSTGEPLYDATDLSSAVPSLPAYTGQSTTLSLPVVNGKQITFDDISWIALYCRQVHMLFMDVLIPEGFQQS